MVGHLEHRREKGKGAQVFCSTLFWHENGKYFLQLKAVLEFDQINVHIGSPIL